jgi:CubicO group peptidase (beta-lactamase class C family)
MRSPVDGGRHRFRPGRAGPLVSPVVLAAAAVLVAGGEVEERTGPAVPAGPGLPAHVLDLDANRPDTRGLDSALVAAALDRAASLPRLRCLLVARHGEILVERCRQGFQPDGYANVKSVSKSVLSALVGTAIRNGHLTGVDQPIAPLLASYIEDDPDPRKRSITVGNLLSMQSGLERTSGRNYGAWVQSPNWVRSAIRRPMVADPGGRMLYSTGNYHMLSAILTERTGRSTMAYAREQLAEPLGITIPSWPRDPQGIYFGGNDMRLSPRAMVRFGELYRNGGSYDGGEVVPAGWVRTSLEPRTRSPWSGEEYGYGWFLGEADHHPMFYAWGYGGQFIFVVPDLELTMVTTSDPNAPRGGRHLRALHDLRDDWIVPAAEIGGGGGEAPDSVPAAAAPVSGDGAAP